MMPIADDDLRSFLGLPNDPLSFELAGKIQDWAEEAAEIWDFETQRAQYRACIKGYYQSWLLGKAAAQTQQDDLLDFYSGGIAEAWNKVGDASRHAIEAARNTRPCPHCGILRAEGEWHACAAQTQDMIKTGLGEVHIIEDPFGPPEEKVAYRVWTSWLEGNLCAELHVVRADLPRERRAMRQLLSARLQALGDALLGEWDKQEWEEEKP